MNTETPTLKVVNSFLRNFAQTYLSDVINTRAFKPEL